MKYVIRAYEQMYSGLHGIEAWCAVEASSLQRAEEDAIEMSYEVMDSYDFIEGELESLATFHCENPEDVDEFEERLEEARAENVGYSIWEVNTEDDLRSINKILAEDPEGYISEYCNLVVCC